jgi:predicted outer membrane protein
MTLGGRRCARWLVVVALAGVAFGGAASPALAAGPPVAPDASGQLPAGWVSTQWGPLGPVDRSLLENVRRADLWEGDVASVSGTKKGTTKEVRDAGRVLREGHIKLETDLRKVAAKLNVALPTELNADQKSWISEMEAASGTAFDEVWVDRLRAAHGKIFSAIATVRTNTRNSLMRQYAEECNDAVTQHMQALEKTGLVEFNMLPLPEAATAAKPAAAQGGRVAGSILNPASSTSGGLSPLVIWALLIMAFGAGGRCRSGPSDPGPLNPQTVSCGPVGRQSRGPARWSCGARAVR